MHPKFTIHTQEHLSTIPFLRKNALEGEQSGSCWEQNFFKVLAFMGLFNSQTDEKGAVY